MPSRSVCRRLHKRLRRLRDLPAPERDAECTRRLLQWRQEVYRCAGSLSAPTVWALANDPRLQEVARALDPSGELQADLNRVCVEAVASLAGNGPVRWTQAEPVPASDRAPSPDERHITIKGGRIR
jgi:hypothetical protein